MSMTLKTTKNLCFGLSVVFKITTRRSTIDVRKKSDLSRKNRTTGPPGHVRKISDQPQPGYGEVTAQSRRGHSWLWACHGSGHGSVTAGCDHFGHRELTVNSPRAVTVANFFLMGTCTHWHEVTPAFTLVAVLFRLPRWNTSLPHLGLQQIGFQANADGQANAVHWIWQCKWHICFFFIIFCGCARRLWGREICRAPQNWKLFFTAAPFWLIFCSEHSKWTSDPFYCSELVLMQNLCPGKWKFSLKHHLKLKTKSGRTT